MTGIKLIEKTYNEKKALYHEWGKKAKGSSMDSHERRFYEFAKHDFQVWGGILKRAKDRKKAKESTNQN